MRIESIQADHYCIPLSQTLTDSTHGEITHFALVTVRVHTETGEEGLGYTYTVGRTGGAMSTTCPSATSPVACPKSPNWIWPSRWTPHVLPCG